MWETKQLLVATDFYSLGNNTMEVNGYRQLLGWTEFSFLGELSL